MKKGGQFEEITLDFLERMSIEMGFSVTRKRIQQSGTQDGYDILIDIVDGNYKDYSIYAESKDYNTKLHYAEALTKIPQLAASHEKIDLALFVSPHVDFSNIYEETRNKPFLEAVANHKFPVAILSPETKIREYFSVFPDLYEKVYGFQSEYLTKKQKLALVEDFKKFLFSHSRLKKIVINDSDRKQFIQDLRYNEFIIKRTVRDVQDRSPYGIYHQKGITILQALNVSSNGILLLGGPGYGKSTELRSFAVELWENRQQYNTIPAFIKLKNFNTASTIDSLLPENALHILGLVIILDGIDEVENITDFTNKLRTFLEKEEKYIELNKIKFVISCRTNVYNKYIKQLDNFNLHFINDINFGSAAIFLLDKYGLDLRQHNDFDYYSHHQIFENPFYLDLIGQYFKTHGILRTDKATLIKEFVESRLDHDSDEKFANDSNFDKDRIISQTKKIAFALESAQRASMTVVEIKKIAGIEETALSKNPFLEQNMDTTWGFENKNIQEYFVAAILTELEFSEILDLVRIDPSLNKTHPSWYNVLSFTLNLGLIDDVYDDLVKWLAKHDHDVLFSADSERITADIKYEVLRNYFEKHCEIETLWVYDISKIAAFSNTEDCIKYIFSKIADSTIHRRARISAIKIFSQMKVPAQFDVQIRNLVKDLLKVTVSEEEYVYIKEDLIQLLGSHNIANDSVYFDEIISIVRDDDHREVVGAIIRNVPSESVEKNIDYFLEILEKAMGEKHWNFTARNRNMTSTKEKIFNLFLRIQNPDLLIYIYEFLLKYHKNNSLRERHLEDFLKHLENIFKDKLDYHTRLTELIYNSVMSGNIRYYEDEMLVSLVRACSIAKDVSIKIINSITGNHDSRHFLADIIEEEQFQEISARYNEMYLDGEFINTFRNILSHRDVELSKRFENSIEEYSDYIFSDKMSQEESKERSDVYKTQHQENFDILFDNQKLLIQITYIFNYLEKDEISKKDLTKVYKDYYSHFPLFKAVRNNAKQLLSEIVREKHFIGKKLNIAEVPAELDKRQYDILLDIYQALPRENNTSLILVSEEHKKFIEAWCISKLEEINENYKTTIIIDKTTWHDEKYQLYELVYNFQQMFLFELDEETLLNMLWLNFRFHDSTLAYMNERVDESAISERILYNIRYAVLSSSSFCNHIFYCMDHLIDLTSLNIDFPAIIIQYLDSGSEHSAIMLIERLYNKNDKMLISFLSYKGNDMIRRRLYDAIIRLLIENSRQSVVHGFLNVNYLDLIADKVYNELEVIRLLVASNESSAFKKLFYFITDNIKTATSMSLGFRNDDWQKYTSTEGITDLVAILELYLATSNRDQLFDSFYLPTRITSEALINICKNHDDATCTLVLEKLDKIDFKSIEFAGGDLFYYHKLKEDITQIYFKHKSNPLNLRKILELLETFRHQFIS